jgi:hypothetical protein
MRLPKSAASISVPLRLREKPDRAKLPLRLCVFARNPTAPSPRQHPRTKAITTSVVTIQLPTTIFSRPLRALGVLRGKTPARNPPIIPSPIP